jgi:hypothetical protein
MWKYEGQVRALCRGKGHYFLVGKKKKRAATKELRRAGWLSPEPTKEDTHWTALPSGHLGEVDGNRAFALSGFRNSFLHSHETLCCEVH